MHNLTLWYYFLATNTEDKPTLHKQIYTWISDIVLLVAILFGFAMLGLVIWAYWKQRRHYGFGSRDYGFGEFVLTVFGTVLLLFIFLTKADIETPLGKLHLESKLNEISTEQSRITQYMSSLDQYQTRLDSLQKKLEQLSETIAAQQKSMLSKDKNLEGFKKYAQYIVLVFYYDPSDSQNQNSQITKRNYQIAKEITDELLNKGFSSSFTGTDFSELPDKGNPGTIRFDYLSSICSEEDPNKCSPKPEAKNVDNPVKVVNKTIQTIAQSPGKIESKPVSRFITGDMQIYIF